MPTEKKDKKNSNPNGKVCGNCSTGEGNESAPKLSACARCSLVYYCSKECQRAHWKANHKLRCISKADRARQQDPREAHKDASAAASVMEKCAICLELLSKESACALPCAHVFHGKCVSELRKFGVEQACPLCRTLLPPGPEKVFEESSRRYVLILRQIETDRASWSALSASAQREVDAAIAGWQAAAEEGHLQAQFNLGVIFKEGRGVTQSDKEAARWFRKAAEQGDSVAQGSLGLLFEGGRGMAKNDKEAAHWFRKAADQGDAQAQCNLGLVFLEGRGVAQSDKEAARWYRKAADQGIDIAQRELGLMLQEGRGVARSDEEAARWFMKAAKQGLDTAQCELGLMFQEGRTSDRAGRARAPTHAHPVFDNKVLTPTRPARAKKRNGRPPAHWASV